VLVARSDSGTYLQTTLMVLEVLGAYFEVAERRTWK
jgi:hypothetical protein